MKPDRRRTTKLTNTAGPMLRDVIELKQAALWHGSKIRIDQACEAAAEGMVRQPKALGISFRSEEVRALSGTHQEHTKSLQTSHLASCISSPSAVELPQMSGGTCREQSSTDASDSSMFGSNCASRPERASSSSRKILRGKGNFPMASIPAADISRSYSFYSPVVSDDSGRNAREETTGSAGDKKSTPLSESGTTSCGEKRKIPQPETFTHSDTSNCRSRSGSVQTTTNGRLGNADLGLSASYRTESVSRECIPGMDDVPVMWSTLESKDGAGRHSGEDGADNRSTSVDNSLSRMCINDATTTDGKQNGDILRMQSVSSVQKSGAHISYYGITCFAVYALMFSSSAHGGASDGTGLRSGGVGRELHNVECSSGISCDTTGATIPTGTASASFVFWHNTGMLQSVRVWTDKTDGNADAWEAAIRHFNKVGTSSCFLMEIDKGCLQPSISDNSIFGEYIGSLVYNAVGNREPAVKTNVNQNRCRVFRKSPWWNLSCDDDIWLREQATMNRAQNSFVDEQLEQVQSTHDELHCYFADHKTMQIRPATTYDLSDKSRICLLDLRDAPSCPSTREKHETLHVDYTIQ